MNFPVITESPGRYTFTWEEASVTIVASRIRQHSDGRVTGEVTVSTTAPGYKPHLYTADHNFSAGRSRKELANILSERMEADWTSILEYLCVKLLELVRRGDPVKELLTSDPQEAPKYLLRPFLLENHPTVIYGEGGVGKSYLALIFATILALPWADNPLGLEAPQQGHRVLYLDYETDEASTLWRLKCLQKGEDLGVLPVYYRRCAMPLADDLEAVQEAKAESKADVIIVDSIGGACGAELNTAETALRYYGALRQLKSTSLSIAHTSKDPALKRKTIYGNTYFFNYARNVFEVKRVQEFGEDNMALGLFHRKNNLGKFYHPQGFKFSFGEDWVKVTSQGIRDMPEFIGQATLSARICTVLQNGDATLAELTSIITEVDKEVLSTTLGRMKDKGRVVKKGDKQWGLPNISS